GSRQLSDALFPVGAQGENTTTSDERSSIIMSSAPLRVNQNFQILVDWQDGCRSPGAAVTDRSFPSRQHLTENESPHFTLPVGRSRSVTVGRSVGRAFLTCARFDDKIRESTSDFRQHIYNAAALSSWCY